MSVMEQEPVRTRRAFTDEFKRDAVALVIDEDRKIIDVARSLGVGEGTLGNWVRQSRVDRGDIEAAAAVLRRSPVPAINSVDADTLTSVVADLLDRVG